MKTDKITVTDLFEKQRRYLIPLFQRGYVWTLEGQWKPLWQDVVNQTEVLRLHNPAMNRQPRRHFLGAIVLVEGNMGVRHVPVSEVIDGQQRITTLQVMLVAFRDVVAGLANAFLTARLQRQTENQGPLHDNAEQLKVWPTNAYREDFKAVVAAGSPEALEQLYPSRRRKYQRKADPRPPLIEAYLFFWDAISTHLRQSDEGEMSAPAAPINLERAERLSDAITNHVQLVEILLENEDDPQIIFETLNARGEPLQPSDLIRNFVFLYATRHNENVDEIYSEYWNEFDEGLIKVGYSAGERFWKQPERQGRLKTNRLDLLVFHYLTYKTESEIKLGHIFQEFRDWWNSSTSDRIVAEELRTLRQSADVFRSLVEPDRSSRFGVFAARLRDLDTTTIYPLILFLTAKRDEMPEGEFDGMLDDLESYLVRRAVCNLTPKNYNRTFLSILQALRSDTVPSRAALRRVMLGMQGDSVVWPDDDQFRRHWMNAPMYSQLGSTKTRMVLEAIDLGLQTPRQERLHIDDLLTIEHVLPQQGNAVDWPLPPVFVDGKFDWEAHNRHERILHCVGNLTLLTQALNSSVSNGPFLQKKAAITLQSRLQLNAYFQRLPDGATWNEEAIVNRATSLFEVARGIWPHP